MRYRLAIAAFSVALLMTPAWGGMRGGSRAFGSGSRGGFSSRGVGGMHGGFGHASRFNGSRFAGSRFGGPRFVGPRFHGRFNGFVRRGPFFHHRRFFGPGPFFYPSFYGGFSYYGGDSYPIVAEPPPAYYPAYRDGADDYDQRQLSSEVDRLSDEVERLREEREARADVPRPPRKTQQETTPPTATVLVFKDKHTQEVQNYAIVGPTLWVFNESRATKVPLASLDVDATTDANDERGVDFQVPK